MELFSFDYWVRIVARVGFILLLLGVYRLWHMPVTKRHSNQFFWLATVASLSSLVFTLVDSYFSTSTRMVLSLLFNTVVIWIIAGHLHWRAFRINRMLGSEKIQAYTEEIDATIYELKKRVNSN